MSELPSIELLRVVLEDESIEFVDLELRVGEFVGYFSNRDRKKKYTDLHRLTHKCKEWAKNKGFVVGTDLDRVNIWSIEKREVINHYEVYFEDYTEFEIKACEWILNAN